MTTEQMLVLLVSSQEDIAKAQARLAPLFSPVVTQAWLDYAVNEGWLQVNTISLDDASIGVIWYHRSSNRELVVSACASFSGEDHFPAFAAASKLIAKSLNCDYVKFETIRPGLAMKALTLGFKVSGLVLSCAV